MAKSYSFDRPTEDSLIEFTAHLDGKSLTMVLDTGATHTVLDFGALIKEGYRLSDTRGLVFIETANGLITANKFRIRELTCLGITREDFEVSSFLFDDPQENVKGILGLDFLRGLEICLNFKVGTVTVK